MVGGWLDTEHTGVGRWHFRSVEYDYIYENNWCAAGEYTWTAPVGTNRSEGFAILISVSLWDYAGAWWWRSSSTFEPNVWTYQWRNRNGYDGQGYNSLGFALLYISVLVTVSGYGTWSRSPAAPYVIYEGTRTWGRIDNENGYPNNGYHDFGFANPRLR